VERTNSNSARRAGTTHTATPTSWAHQQLAHQQLAHQQLAHQQLSKIEPRHCDWSTAAATHSPNPTTPQRLQDDTDLRYSARPDTPKCKQGIPQRGIALPRQPHDPGQQQSTGVKTQIQLRSVAKYARTRAGSDALDRSANAGSISNAQERRVACERTGEQ
jgi:hypothetical protein